MNSWRSYPVRKKWKPWGIWLLEWLKAVGFYHAALTKQMRGAKDRKTYVLAPAEIDLSLYNLAGQRVTVLAQGERPAGVYTVRWDGRDDRGQALASGVYLYRLQAGDRAETRRLVLVR